MTVCISFIFFFSSRRRHTRCALVTGVQTCALPIFFAGTTLQRVVAGEAGKEIVARTAAEAVRRTVSAEHIVDSTADDVLDGDRLLGNAGSFHHAFRQVGLDHFPGIWEEEGVAAEAAFVAVDAKIAAQAVVSSAAAQQVVAGERSEEHTSELQS